MPSKQFLTQQACLNALGKFYPKQAPQRAAQNILIGVCEEWWYTPRFFDIVRQEYRRLVQIHGEPEGEERPYIYWKLTPNRRRENFYNAPNV